LKTAFDKLSQGAEVTNPLKEVFFGVYGDLNDRFGVRWMFQNKQAGLAERQGGKNTAWEQKK